LRQQKCIITREEGRKITICVRDGAKLITSKSIGKISGKLGQSKSYRKLRKNDSGSHRVLTFRAPSEGIADLWSAWMKSAAMCGEGGEKNVAVIEGKKSVDALLDEDWQVLVPLPGMVAGRASASRLQGFQEDLTRIASHNKKRIEEMRQDQSIDIANIALRVDTSGEEGEEGEGEDAVSGMNYPFSPISFETGAAQNEASGDDSGSSSGYDCDSGDESSLLAL
jgi:hypothetical protein